MDPVTTAHVDVEGDERQALDAPLDRRELRGVRPARELRRELVADGVAQL
jgi:hypothetical protein